MEEKETTKAECRQNERTEKKTKQSSVSSSINGDPSTSSTPNAGQLFKLCCEHSYSQLTSSSSSDPSTSVFLISSPPGNRPDGEEESSESHSDEKSLYEGHASSPSFDDEMAQAIFDDWVVSLPLSDCKMLAVLLMETVQKRFNIKSGAAALEAAWMTGFNEKTVHNYRKQFFENRGKFKEEGRGKYKRFYRFDRQSLQQ